jgi:hypothetical protein
MTAGAIRPELLAIPNPTAIYAVSLCRQHGDNSTENYKRTLRARFIDELVPGDIVWDIGPGVLPQEAIVLKAEAEKRLVERKVAEYKKLGNPNNGTTEQLRAFIDRAGKNLEVYTIDPRLYEKGQKRVNITYDRTGLIHLIAEGFQEVAIAKGLLTRDLTYSGSREIESLSYIVENAQARVLVAALCYPHWATGGRDVIRNMVGTLRLNYNTNTNIVLESEVPHLLAVRIKREKKENGNNTKA